MNLWRNLLNNSLVGSRNQPLPPLTEPGPLTPLLAQLDPAQPEASLLSAAALCTQYQQTSFVPVQDATPLPEAAVAETVPALSLAAADYLPRLIELDQRLLVLEWLTAVSASQQRLPFHLLVTVLTYGTLHVEARPAILAVIGHRGRWLARKKGSWRYAAEPATAVEWQQSSGTARHLFFQQLRQTNPEEARQLLQTTWDTEPVNERLAALESLRFNLSLADEPFLESCLDQDRSNKVRSLAARLLACLPDSQLVARMIARIRPLLNLVEGAQPSLQITLPTAVEEAWQRDGIEDNYNRSFVAMGRNAWTFCQLLACIPPNFWLQTWGKNPAQLIELAIQNEHKVLLLEGWAEATLRHPDPDWAAVLLQQESVSHRHRALMQALPVSQQEQVALQLVDTVSNKPKFFWLAMVSGQWSEAYGREVLDRFRSVITSASPIDPLEWRWVAGMAVHFPPSLADEAAALWQPHPDTAVAWQPILDQFNQIIRLRYDMITAIHPQKEQL